MTERVILLGSGGLDSTTVAYSLAESGYTILPLFFDYGQHCVEKEWDTLRSVLPENVETPLRVDISGIFKGSSSRLISEANPWAEDVQPEDLYIPYRTLLFFSASAAVAQTHRLTEVYSGFINSNHAKELDCGAKFMNDLEELSEGVGPVRFRMPLRYHSKREVAELAARLGVPIGRTYSCQLYSNIPCGACPNCVDRLDALAEAGFGL